MQGRYSVAHRRSRNRCSVRIPHRSARLQLTRLLVSVSSVFIFSIGCNADVLNFLGFGTNAGGGGLFGTAQPTATSQPGGSIFGSTAQPGAAGGLFGTTTMAPPGTTVKFNPKIDTDTMLKNNMQQNIQTKHQCISAMKEYESKSLEVSWLQPFFKCSISKINFFAGASS